MVKHQRESATIGGRTYSQYKKAIESENMRKRRKGIANTIHQLMPYLCEERSSSFRMNNKAATKVRGTRRAGAAAVMSDTVPMMKETRVVTM